MRALHNRKNYLFARSDVGDVSIGSSLKKVERKQLVLDRDVNQRLDKATSLAGLRLTELTGNILVNSWRFPAAFHGDPADEILSQPHGIMQP